MERLVHSEAIARAHAINGNKEEYAKNYMLAKAAGEKLEKEEDKKVFMSDLKSEPWNGMK